MTIKQKYESLQALKIASSKYQFTIYGNLEKNNNTFESISLSEKDYIFGLAYYNHGIDSQLLWLDKASKVMLGFDHHIIGLDCEAKVVLIQKETIAPFYELIEAGSFILGICELDIFAFDFECRLVWSAGFRDIIEDYKIMNDEVITVQCSNGDKSAFDLKTGTVLR